MAHRSSSPSKVASAPGGLKSPVWLYRVENDEMSTLLRASSQYAKKGYDETLARQKEQSQNNLRASQVKARKFENSMLSAGAVSTQYLSKATGRSLTTQLPHERPPPSASSAPSSTGAVKQNQYYYQQGPPPPVPAGKEILRAAEVRNAQLLNAGKAQHDEDAEVLRVFGAPESSHKGPKMELSRVPLSKLKGLVHYPVGEQLVTLPPELLQQQAEQEAAAARRNHHHEDGDSHGGSTGRRGSMITIGSSGVASALGGSRSARTPQHTTGGGGGGGGGAGKTNGVDDPPDKERQTLPRASDVLKRYKLFTVRTDEPANRNLDEMLNPPSFDYTQLAKPVAASAIVAAGRAELQNSKTTVQVAPPSLSVPANTKGLPYGATSHAILQNRMGSTFMGGDALPRGGSGLIVGDLFVTHDQLTPATLVAAKWGRIANTVYGKAPGEPCRLRCEMQPLYYESFMKDMTSIMGGPHTFTFTPDIDPAVFLVDVGSVNAVIHGHRPSGVRAPPIGDVNVVPDARENEEEDESSDNESSDDNEKKNAVDGAHKKKKKKSNMAMTKFGLGDIANARHSNSALKEDELRAHKLKRKKKKKKKLVTNYDEIRRAELKMAMDSGKENANLLLLKLGTDGNDFAIEQLLKRGYKIDYEPNPWYMRNAEKTKQKKLEARSRTFAEEEKAGDVDPHAPKPKNMAGYTQKLGGGAGEGENDDGDDTAAAGAQKPVKHAEVFVRPEVNTRDLDGNTPLMNAAKNGWVDAAIVLLRHGADHTRKNDLGQTAYDLAKAESHMASLALGVNVPGAAERKRRAAKMMQMLDDRTVLVCAQKGDMRRLQYLITDCGHPCNATNQYGMTPLHFAIIRRDLPMIVYLAECGADPNARNNLGQTPLSMVMDAPGDILQGKLLEALAAGDKMRARESAKMNKMASDAADAAKHEKHLISALKTATKGTTAAKAVYLSLSRNRRDPDFGPPAGVRRPDPGTDDMGYAVRGSTRPSTSLTGMVNLPHVVNDGTTNASSSSSLQVSMQPIPASLKQAAAKGDSAALAESWNRHVMNYLASTQKAARIADTKRAIAARELQEEVEASHRRYSESAQRRSRGGMMMMRSESPLQLPPERVRPDTATSGYEVLPPSSAMGQRLADAADRTTTTHTSRLPMMSPMKGGGGGGGGRGASYQIETQIRRALIEPMSLSEHALRKEPIPAADSERFDTWARMRFGAI